MVDVHARFELRVIFHCLICRLGRDKHAERNAAPLHIGKSAAHAAHINAARVGSVQSPIRQGGREAFMTLRYRTEKIHATLLAGAELGSPMIGL